MPSVRQLFNMWSSRNFPYSKEDLSYFVNLLNKKEHFSFSRYGDGEWSAAIGTPGENCDGHAYTKGLQEGLQKALQSNHDYFYGVQPFALKSMGHKIKKYIKKNNISIKWYDAGIFHDANITAKLNPFIQVLRKNKVVMIGPSHLRQLELFPIYEFIEVPSKNCFDDYDRIYDDILNWGKGQSDVIYLFSASMASNVLIDNLYPYLGAENWLLDIGALWDVYVNVKSRSVYNDFDWKEIIAENTKQ